MCSTMTIVASTMMPKSRAPMAEQAQRHAREVHAGQREEQRQRDDHGGEQRRPQRRAGAAGACRRRSRSPRAARVRRCGACCGPDRSDRRSRRAGRPAAAGSGSAPRPPRGRRPAPRWGSASGACSTMPSTPPPAGACPSTPKKPVCGWAPIRTRPTSRTKIGTPRGASSTMFSMSSVDWMRPVPRIGSDCWPSVEQRAAGVAGVVLHGVGDLPDAQPVLVEASRIELDLVLADQAAEGHDVGDPLHLQEARRDHPVLDLAQLHRVEAGPLARRSDRARRCRSRAGPASA